MTFYLYTNISFVKALYCVRVWWLVGGGDGEREMGRYGMVCEREWVSELHYRIKLES